MGGENVVGEVKGIEEGERWACRFLFLMLHCIYCGRVLFERERDIEVALQKREAEGTVFQLWARFIYSDYILLIGIKYAV